MDGNLPRHHADKTGDRRIARGVARVTPRPHQPAPRIRKPAIALDHNQIDVALKALTAYGATMAAEYAPAYLDLIEAERTAVDHNDKRVANRLATLVSAAGTYADVLAAARALRGQEPGDRNKDIVEFRTRVEDAAKALSKHRAKTPPAPPTMEI